MKKLIAGIGIALTVCGCCGCDDCSLDKEPSQWKDIGRNTHVRIATIDGHDYLLCKGSYTCSIMHAASCKCHKDLHN